MSNFNLFDIFKSERFWALVIGALAVVAEGNFTLDAWLKGVMIVVGGFATIRTVDRVADKKVEAAQVATGATVEG